MGDCSQQQNDEHVCWNTYFCSGGFSVLHVFCHFPEEVTVLIAQVVGAQLAVVVQQHTPHCRQTGISGIHKYYTQGKIYESTVGGGVLDVTYNVLFRMP